MKQFSAFWVLIFWSLSATILADNTANFFKAIKKGKTLSGHFVQSVTDKIGTLYETVDGTFAVKRPNKFFWKDNGEDGQKIISNGTRVWVEQPDLANAVHTSLEDILKTSPIAILLTPDKIKKIFKIVPMPKIKGKLLWFKLVPYNKETMNFEQLTVAIYHNELKQIRIKDSFDRTITIKLLSVSYNLKLSNWLFEYEPKDSSDE